MTLLHLWKVREKIEYADCHYDNSTHLTELIADKPHQEWEGTTKVCVASLSLSRQLCCVLTTKQGLLFLLLATQKGRQHKTFMVLSSLIRSPLYF